MVKIFFGKGLILDLSGLINYLIGKIIFIIEVMGCLVVIVNDYLIFDGGFVMMRYLDGSMKVVG